MNATVTLPISELDNLRDTIKIQSSRIDELESTQKEVKVTTTEKVTWAETRFNAYRGGYEYVDITKDVIDVKYVNLDSIIEGLKTEAEDKVRDKIQSLTYEVKKLKDELVKQEESWRDKVKLEKDLCEKITKSKDEEISILKGEQGELRKDHIIKIQGEAITDLESKLASLNLKLTGGFLSKLKLLFNI